MEDLRERVDGVLPLIEDLGRDCAKAPVVVRTRAVRHFDGRHCDLYAKQEAAYPTQLAQKAGMIANELRACLDSLACELAIRNGGTTSGVQFPIMRSEAAFRTSGRKWIHKLSTDDQARIERLRPFADGESLYWTLHQIDRQRKHIKLVTATAGSTIDFGSIQLAGSTGVQVVGMLPGQSDLPLCVVQTAAPAVGQEFLLLSNVPMQTPVLISFEPGFGAPDEARGMPLPLMLEMLQGLVDRTLTQFD